MSRWDDISEAILNDHLDAPQFQVGDLVAAYSGVWVLGYVTEKSSGGTRYNVVDYYGDERKTLRYIAPSKMRLIEAKYRVGQRVAVNGKVAVVNGQVKVDFAGGSSVWVDAGEIQ